MLKLNIGCGSDLKKDFINIDVKKEFAKNMSDNNFIAVNIKEGLPFKNEIFDFVIAQDILEHFNKYEVHIIFSDIVRVMKLNSSIFIRVPDFELILNYIFQSKINFQDSLDLIFGEPLIASQVYTGDFGVHKWGSSKKSLKIFGKKFGVDFEYIENKGFNIEAIGIKKNIVDFQSLMENIKITSWGNRVGIGKPYITLKEFMEKFYHEN